ncbi:uncharacterized protein LOC107304623 isoform X2 [Oryza brachyantha]|uniref:uncharacterized protein LOC107304623 isoform X2 n=1 Tax=Oryza brachyantha TaxID=4533 RepID=UPI000776A4D7|nr:uncharacterized protein LOC107304623 isoform X2 [Oryza brachyantha]
MASSNRKRLRMLLVSSMESVDSVTESPHRVQLYVDPKAAVTDAISMNLRMRPGDRTMAFELHNPEVLRRKVEADAGLRGAIARVERSEEKLRTKIQRTERKILEVEANLNLDRDAIRARASNNRRSLPFQQVIYKSGEDIPEGEVAAPKRKLSKKARRESKTLDVLSQVAYWNANWFMLNEKKNAQEGFLAALLESKEAFLTRCLESRSNIGCGYTVCFL